MDEPKDQLLPLDCLLVPTILEDEPKCFDRSCDPSWIFGIGLVAGTAIAAIFRVINRDKLDGHRRGIMNESFKSFTWINECSQFQHYRSENSFGYTQHEPHI